MDIARPILHAQDVRRLRQMRQDRVVAGHLPVMGIEPSEGALDLHAGRHHGAIDIDRQGPQGVARDHPCHHRGIQRLQRRHRAHREPLQPAADGPSGRHDAQAGEPPNHDVILHEHQMPQPSAAHDQQRQQQADQRHQAEVAPGRRAGTGLPDQGVEAGLAQVPARTTPVRRRT